MVWSVPGPGLVGGLVWSGPGPGPGDGLVWSRTRAGKRSGLVQDQGSLVVWSRVGRWSVPGKALGGGLFQDQDWEVL